MHNVANSAKFLCRMLGTVQQKIKDSLAVIFVKGVFAAVDWMDMFCQLADGFQIWKRKDNNHVPVIFF